MFKIRVSKSFLDGAKEGFFAALPLSVGFIPWALVTGIAMVSAGFTPFQAMGMNLIVYAGVAQLGTLPLIIAGSPLWLITVTALVLNLRFLIFSAAIARGFRGSGALIRWLSSYLLVDGVFAVCVEKMQTEEDKQWRLGYYLAPSAWGWLLWQVFVLAGIFAAKIVPKSWSLEFMATIAIITILIPMAKMRPMLVAAAAAGISAVALRSVPLRLGFVIAIIIGIAAGFLAEHLQSKKGAA